MATVEESAAAVVVLSPEEEALAAQGAQADAFYNPDYSAFLTPAEETLAQLGAQADAFYNPTPILPVDKKSTQKKQVQVDNPLFDYESYTYNLSWHILSPQDYKNMTNNPGTAYIPKNCLIASGGKNSSSFARNPYFTEDFYFEDFKITTVVNTTKLSKNSNAIDISFTVVEPNGFTLINRLIDACTANGGVNYLKNPYLLMVEFTGYKDGTPVNISNQTKYIPFALIGMQTSLTAKGAVYKIQAAPFNHQAYQETMIKTPAIIKVQARKVQDLLCTLNPTDTNTEAIIQSQLNQRSFDIAEIQKILNDPTASPADKADAQASISSYSTSSIEYAAESLCDGINSWLVALASNTQAIVYPNQYRIVFDAEIGNSEFVSSLGQNVSNAATKNTANKTAAAATGKSVNAIDFTSGVFTIKPGTNILNVIDYAVRNSKYITGQLVDPLANNVGISQFRLQKGNSLKWYRVVPKIELGAYDRVTNKFQMFVTYYVKTWTVNVKNPYAPLGRSDGYVKRYDYLFTGRNRDVLDMKIDFDMLFYVQLSADVNKNLKSTGTGTQGVPDSTRVPSYITYQSDPIQPISVSHVSSNQTTSSRTGPDEGKAIRAGDQTRELTQSSRGDMINLKLRILGDPQFIKQDDIFYNQGTTPGIGQFVSATNQSLVFDDGELYVYVNFESPNDINDATGLAIPGVTLYGQRNYQYSAFSGVYKVITVDNEFRQGKFEQTLDLVRLPVSDNLRDQALNIQSRTDSLISQGLGQLLQLPATKFTGPLVLVNNLATSGIASSIAAAANGGAGNILSNLASKFIGDVTKKLMGEVTGKITEFGSQIFEGLKLDITEGLNSFRDIGPSLDVMDDFASEGVFNTDIIGGLDISNITDFPSVDVLADFGW